MCGRLCRSLDPGPNRPDLPNDLLRPVKPEQPLVEIKGREEWTSPCGCCAPEIDGSSITTRSPGKSRFLTDHDSFSSWPRVRELLAHRPDPEAGPSWLLITASVETTKITESIGDPGSGRSTDLPNRCRVYAVLNQRSLLRPFAAPIGKVRMPANHVSCEM